MKAHPTRLLYFLLTVFVLSVLMLTVTACARPILCEICGKPAFNHVCCPAAPCPVCGSTNLCDCATDII